MTGGSSHASDIKQLIGENECFLDYLDKSVRDRIQMVLCGFNVIGKTVVLDENGYIKESRDQKPSEVWWSKIERQITHDYQDVSPKYRELLLKYDKSDETFDASNEPYKRVWSKYIKDGEYGKIYEDIDILLVPLTDTKFNSMKSNLKFVEAGFTNTAVIASNVAPYSDYGTGYRDCIFVDKPTCKCWADAVEGLVSRADKRLLITRNLNKKVLEDCNLEDITRKRHKFLQDIAK